MKKSDRKEIQSVLTSSHKQMNYMRTRANQRFVCLLVKGRACKQKYIPPSHVHIQYVHLTYASLQIQPQTRTDASFALFITL